MPWEGGCFSGLTQANKQQQEQIITFEDKQRRSILTKLLYVVHTSTVTTVT